MVYDGGMIAAEVANPGGAILRRYVPGPGIDEPIVWYEGSGTGDRRWLQADERGSIVAVSDAAGNGLAINRYDEYGIPQSGNLGRFQYTGQVWLPEIGMYYYKARMYSPTLGRFMQTDPIGYGDGLNWYNCVGSDPVNHTDPWGLLESSIVVNGVKTPPPVFELPGPVYYVDTSNFNSGLEVGDGYGDEIVVTAVLCAGLTKQLSDGKGELPKRVTAPKIWNDPAALKFYQLTYRDNANDFWVAGKVASWGTVPLAFIPAGRAVNVATAAGSAGLGELLAAQQAMYEKWDKTIQARLDQIEAQREGSCLK